MSNLVRHAAEEMKRAGLFDADSDYGGMIPAAVLRLVETHAAEGHSGGSHAAVLAIFNKVVNFEPLTPLTSNPDEWMKVDPDHYQPGTWQNRRKGSTFSRDGGQTWYDIDTPGSWSEAKARALKSCADLVRARFSLSDVEGLVGRD